jgi:putative addiction module component (TIGR02574 family)
MTRDLIIAEALQLPQEDRRLLADKLRDTLEDPAARQAAIDDAHYAEVMRRCKLIDEGKMELIPWEEAEAQIFGTDD